MRLWYHGVGWTLDVLIVLVGALLLTVVLSWLVFRK